MKKCTALLFVLILCSGLVASAQNDTLALLFHNSYKAYELMRNDLGMYRDSKLFVGNDYHPSSIASTGMGLISLCIADAMGWDQEAPEKVLITLQSITGFRPGFMPDRNPDGFYRHWIDMRTGKREWKSEYSTIDTGILTAGALFCKKYFCGNDRIQHYADQLWNSTNWPKAIGDAEKGQIYMVMLEDGTADPQQITKPFNEYMIVAWLAMQQEADQQGPAHLLWNQHYADPESLTKKQSNLLELSALTDNPRQFLSSFVIQFPYYLCHHFTASPAYVSFFEHARKLDSAWWANQGESYMWGSGAGSDINGYHADAVNNNPSSIFSPHIIAGFLPVYEAGKQDLIKLYHTHEGTYFLPNDAQDKVLWRRSISQPDWRASEIQGVDYASMLFGLATLPVFLGKDFFLLNNDFFSGECMSLPITRKKGKTYRTHIHFDPNTATLSLSISYPTLSQFSIQIVSTSGETLRERHVAISSTNQDIQLDCTGLTAGPYYVQVSSEEKILMRQLIMIE